MNSILRPDIIECYCHRRNSPNYFRIPKMTDNKNLADLRNKVLRRATKIQKLTEVEQINLENEWTEFLKNLVDYGNTHYLRSYALRLEME
jgi:hypothetical protein